MSEKGAGTRGGSSKADRRYWAIRRHNDKLANRTGGSLSLDGKKIVDAPF